MADDRDWKIQLKYRYLDLASLPPDFEVSGGERAFAKTMAGAQVPPFAVTGYYLSLAENRVDDPIRRQFMPSPEEARTTPWELDDPLGENRFSPCPRLVHQYRDRALLLTTGACAVYCRHCFRRNYTRREEGFISDRELVPVESYLREHGEISQLLLSGGDVLTGSDDRIGNLLSRLRAASPRIVFRVCTRIPAVLPARITAGLLSVIAKEGPAWFVVHYNHPRELSPESLSALARIVDAGIPVLSQTVLLRGVNDSAETLAELFQGLVAARVKPYYLFQGDLAKGTAHLRTPIDEGLMIYSKLRTMLSPLALPSYAVDLPGGGGKISLTDGALVGAADGCRTYRSPLDGLVYRYPVEN